MTARVWMIGICGLWLAWGAVALAEEPATPANQNSLVREYAGKLKFSASSEWLGWPAERAFDGNPATSWFTQRGDAAAKGTKPYIMVEFPHDVTIKRVTLLSNREPPWETGYTILVGRVELVDEKGKVLVSQDDELGGERHDMDVRPKKPVEGVRKVRFTSLRDEGDKNPYDDVAVGEVLIE